MPSTQFSRIYLSLDFVWPGHLRPSHLPTPSISTCVFHTTSFRQTAKWNMRTPHGRTPFRLNGFFIRCQKVKRRAQFSFLFRIVADGKRWWLWCRKFGRKNLSRLVLLRLNNKRASVRFLSQTATDKPHVPKKRNVQIQKNFWRAHLFWTFRPRVVGSSDELLSCRTNRWSGRLNSRPHIAVRIYTDHRKFRKRFYRRNDISHTDSSSSSSPFNGCLFF